MYCILAEKPDQARKLAAPYKHKNCKTHIEIEDSSFPGGRGVVVWAIGHLVQLAPPEAYKDEWKEWKLETLPIIPDSFKYEVIKDKVSHFRIVRDKLKEANSIIIATDPAREGELIARLIINLSGCKGKDIKRLWCASLTESAIKEAFRSLKDGKSTEKYYAEAIARSHSDWIVGLSTSRLYTILMREKGIRDVFSSGRVQTPVLCMINKRWEEINTFKPTPYWEIFGTFISNNQSYEGKLQNDTSNRFLEKEKAQEIVAALTGKKATIKDKVTELKQTQPPMLHSLSTLQTDLNKKYKYSPQQVLDLVQKLYERGIVSYPRTASRHVTPAEAEQFPIVLESLKKLDQYGHLVQFAEISSNKRYIDASKVEDHFAIIPTEQLPNIQQLTQDEWNVYDTIVKSFLAIHHENFKYNQTTLLTHVEGYEFKTTGREIVEEGWKKVYGGSRAEETEDEKGENQTIPLVDKGDEVQNKQLQMKESLTKPKRPYTEGQLIALMETAGRQVESSDEIDIKLGDLSIGTPATRAGIIQTLKAREYIVVNKNIVHVTDKGKMLVEAVRGTVLESAEMTAKWESVLQKIGTTPDKAFNMSQAFIEKSKELTRVLIKQALESRSKWNVDAYIENIKQEQEKENQGLGVCPNCKKGNIKDRKNFYGCTGYKDGCKFTLPKEILGRKINEANAGKLISGKKTGLIKGLKSPKSGKEFDAYLVLKDNKITFEFPVVKKTEFKGTRKKA